MDMTYRWRYTFRTGEGKMLKDSNEINIEKDIVYSIIPVEHLMINSIDRLGEYLLVNIPFLVIGEYDSAEELSYEERIVLEILLKNEKIMEFLLDLEWCTVFICRDSKNIDIESRLYDVVRACDLLAISQYRYDRKEWTIGNPGIIGNYKVFFRLNVSTKEIAIVSKEEHFFNEIPGIGLEVSDVPLSRNNDFYPIIFSDRQDEVYMTCRYYITKACRTFSIPSLQSTFSELFATLEGLGMIGCSDYVNFTKENKRIMAVNSDNQNEFETKLDTFCYYSEVLRTLVLHQGHSLLDYMDRKSAFRLLTSIFWEIITFAKNIINTGICSINDINTYIEDRINRYEDHISSVKTSFVLKNEEKGIDGDRDIFIFPIANLVLNKYVLLGDLLIIPQGFLAEYKQKSENSVLLDDFYISDILDDNLIEQNKEISFLLYKGLYQMDQFDTSEESWQYIDDICGEIQNMLVPLFVQNNVSAVRDKCIGAVGVYNGIRGGAIFDSAYGELKSICGRVYSLYNCTDLPFVLEEKNVNRCHAEILSSNKRDDEVAIGCRKVLSVIGKAMREDNVTYLLMDMFDAVDNLYPCDYKMPFKWKWIASFVMDQRSEYDRYHNRLTEISKMYRTPMYHYGKNASELFVNKEEAYKLFNEVKNYILKCVGKMYKTGITSWEELKQYRIELMNGK